MAHEAAFFIEDPPQGWANPSDCVEFTCTGMYNIVIQLEGIQTVGTFQPNVNRQFTVISDNKESVSASAIPTCEFEPQWNSW